MKLSEEDFETLEDHQLQIQNMMGSRYPRDRSTPHTQHSTVCAEMLDSGEHYCDHQLQIHSMMGSRTGDNR